MSKLFGQNSQINYNKNIIVALVGNPNVGKSTIFNIVTGATQYVGNYPGVTIDKTIGIKKYKNYAIHFVDLPGIYSLSSYTDDAKITVNFLLNEQVDVIIYVIDSSNLERNLYLFTQIIELNKNVIIMLNMLDLLQAKHKSININQMSNILGLSVFPIIAHKKIGIDTNFLKHIIHLYNNKHISSAKVDYGEDIICEIDKVYKLLAKNKDFINKIHKTWFIIKLLEKDTLAIKLINIFQNKAEILQQVEKSRRHIIEHFNTKIEVEIANKRYGFAKAVVKMTINKQSIKQIDINEIIDDYVLNKYCCIPILLIIIYIIFKFTFAFSEPVVNLFNLFFKFLSFKMSNLIQNSVLKSLIVDGFIGGIGGVFSFFPVLLFMFFSIAFFEDSGYMARASFIMDKILNKFGLTGKSFLPLIIATNGCAVPGMLATRTLESKRDRIITMFIVPYMICGAKIPVCMLIIKALFSYKYQTIVMFCLYIVSIIVALSISKVLSKIISKDYYSHFIMELPPYHLPKLSGLLLKMWERSWLYIRKAWTIVVLTSLFVWGMFTFTLTHSYHNIVEYSIKIINPIFKPIGMDGNKAIALLSGLIAKEMVISTLSTMYSVNNSNKHVCLKDKIHNSQDWSILQGVTFIIFCLTYVPCITSMLIFCKEIEKGKYKWFTLMLFGNTALAWLLSFLTFKIGTLLNLGT
ncbi:MAG: ferrous iron transport protein B [Endomicrobium sp.]|jgi:ferrous iron transport protein B|nr:ferrous iron transport protein B [Endomicrobium sp.]